MIYPLIIARPYLQCYTNGIVERDFFESLSKDRFAPTIIASDRENVNFKSDNVVRCSHENVFLYKILSVLGHIGFNDVVYQPDQMWYPWGLNATKLALATIKSSHIDYIHSVSMDFVNHIIGLHLKEQTKLPWIAQFLEPWSDNPFKKYKTKWGRQKFDLYEFNIAINADLILHTNTAVADRWIQRYGREIAKKIEVLPIVTNKPIAPESRIASNDKLIITHIGHFYGSRNGISFLKAISFILSKMPDLCEKVVVNFIGKVTTKENNYIEQNGLSDIVRVLGILSEEESNLYLFQSDILLVIDPVDGDGLFFPSKLIKYFYAQKPIIGITQAGSVTDCELEQSGNYSFDFNDIEGIALFLLKAISDYNSICTCNTEYWKNFSKEKILLDYENMIKKII